MDKKEYYTYPSIRKVRRKCRNACRLSEQDLGAVKAVLILRDENGRNIFKTRRVKARLRTHG